MHTLKNRLAALALLAALFVANSAHALQTWHVNVDTRAFSGLALLDFTFLANAGATPAVATLRNFEGAFGAVHERSAGVSGSIPGELTLSNQNGGSYLTQIVTLGGWLGFDIRFDGAFAGTENIDASLFAAALYTSDFSAYIGEPGSVVEFALLPQAGGIAGSVAVSAPTGLASISPVPEPSALLMALSGLALLGMARLRRK